MKTSAQEISISVIIPCYNSSQFIGEAIDSVLAEGLPNAEVLIVDDGSTDDSLEIARSFPQIRCLHQENQGAAAARNYGIHQSKGNILAFLDADDIWRPEGIKHLLEILEANLEFELVLGRMQWVGKKVWKDIGQPDLIAPPLATFGFGASVIRRRAFARTGMLNEQLKRGEDTEWFLRARENGVRSYLTEEVVLYYRRHEGNITQDPEPIASLTLQLVKASLDRRRGHGKIQALEHVEIAKPLKDFLTEKK